MSHIFVSGLVIILNHILPLIGLSWPDTQVGQFASALVDIGAALWVMIRRYKMGGITRVGTRN